jgi:two-component system, NtrC family, sensor kinase
MPHLFPPHSPLARSTLIKMGGRIAVVIALCTLFGYLRLQHTVRAEALAQLTQYVRECGTQAESIFLLAEDTQSLLARDLGARVRAAPAADEDTRFDRLFVQLPDGTVRTRSEDFDGTRQVSLFAPQGVAWDAALRHRVLAAHELLTQYGPAFRVRFVDTVITLPEGPVLSYSPERPHHSQELEPGFTPLSLEYFRSSLPENNPQRRPVWTRVYKEEVSSRWMVTVTTPLDLEGRHVAALSHDVMLEELIARTLNDHLPESYNILFRDDGELIAHPRMKAADGQLVLEADEEHLHEIMERVKNRQNKTVVELPSQGLWLAVARLQGTDWNFVTVLPEHVVARPALEAARTVLLIGVLSLLLELGIMSWVLREQISQPLRAFSQATARVSAGDFQVDLDTARQDELGQLAQSFETMATRLRRREEDLRAANEGLEQRVEERTRELRGVHQQLVQTARRTGMAEIATNVLHNVGNVLTSVYTSSQVAKERVQGMRLDHVSRVAQMLQARRADLAAFLTEDERGKLLTPFLDKLGQNLMDERHEVISLLEDVGRYTEHIGEIVKVQQDYARTPRLHEPVVLAELVEDALRINAAGLTRHRVTVERRLESVPPVVTDKHKMLMILVNLVSNAKYALDPVPEESRRLVVGLRRSDEGSIHIALRDNGMGIAPELLTRIFQYGFTTRQEGHGFGLHSSALAAQELGGVLHVESEGPGLGATFTLVLPPPPVQAET